VDARLYELIAPALDGYLEAAARRRQFGIALLPVLELDDRRPEELRAALHGWHAAKQELEGALFVGNIKLPSFFLPRADIHSVRLWPRYFEDLDMTVTQRVAPGTVLKSQAASTDWPKIVGAESLVVPPHDYDDLAEGSAPGPELWAAFLPVGYAEPAKNNYAGWAGQLDRFFKKATAFHRGEVKYGRGLYLVSNDLGLLERGKPAWDAVGAAQIEFYAINEKGPGSFLSMANQPLWPPWAPCTTASPTSEPPRCCGTFMPGAIWAAPIFCASSNRIEMSKATPRFCVSFRKY
jgi:hypothetical protein